MKLTNYISEAIDNMAKYENIENIGKLIKNGAVAELSKRISVAEKTASDILKKLNELETAARQKRAEEELAAKAAAEIKQAESLPEKPEEVVVEVRNEQQEIKPVSSVKSADIFAVYEDLGIVMRIIYSEKTSVCKLRKCCLIDDASESLVIFLHSAYIDIAFGFRKV